MAKLAKVKTKPTGLSVGDFLGTVAPEQKRKDSEAIMQMMQKATKETPRLWGTALIGFGYLVVKSPASGREVEWFKIGFAPRKANISLYLNLNVQSQTALLSKLGKHKTGMGCLYINKLEDVDVKVLEEMIAVAAAGKRP
jgi:hypothetical protein